jgi:hypothetical protein
MARLNEADKAAFKRLASDGWVESPDERSPVFVEPTARNNAAYCQWVSGLSKWIKAERPVRFTGSNWKL